MVELPQLRVVQSRHPAAQHIDIHAADHGHRVARVCPLAADIPRGQQSGRDRIAEPRRAGRRCRGRRRCRGERRVAPAADRFEFPGTALDPPLGVEQRFLST